MNEELIYGQLTKHFPTRMDYRYGLSNCLSVCCSLSLPRVLASILPILAYIIDLQPPMGKRLKYRFTTYIPTYYGYHRPLIISRLSHTFYSLPRAYGVRVYIYTLVYIYPSIWQARRLGIFKSRSGGWI